MFGDAYVTWITNSHGPRFGHHFDELSAMGSEVEVRLDLFVPVAHLLLAVFMFYLHLTLNLRQKISYLISGYGFTPTVGYRP